MTGFFGFGSPFLHRAVSILLHGIAGGNQLGFGNLLDGWEVVNGGAAPENVLHEVRELAPEWVLLIDAADMDLPAGSIRWIRDDKLDDPFLLTTHTLPLTFMIEALREFVRARRIESLRRRLGNFEPGLTHEELRKMREDE